MITIPQKNFLENLLIDCQLWTPPSQRLGFLSERCGRPIKYIDELMKDEASRIIEELIDKRDREQKNRRTEGQEGMF